MKILFFFLFLNLAQASPQATCHLFNLPTPSPFSGHENTPEEDDELFIQLKAEYLDQNQEMIESVRHSFQDAVYIRTEMSCNVHDPMVKATWEQNPEMDQQSRNDLIQLISQLVNRPKSVFIPASLTITADPDQDWSCRVKLKAWGTPYSTSRTMVVY